MRSTLYPKSSHHIFSPEIWISSAVRHRANLHRDLHLPLKTPLTHTPVWTKISVLSFFRKASYLVLGVFLRILIAALRFQWNNILFTMVIFSLYSLSSHSLSYSDPPKKNAFSFLPPSAAVGVGREETPKLIPLLLLISLPVHPLTWCEKQDCQCLLNATHT